MTRQVRLDDDVVEEVERRADGLSLSGATNLLLRSLLAAEARTPAEARRVALSELDLPSEPFLPKSGPLPRLEAAFSPPGLAEEASHPGGWPEPRPPPTRTRRAKRPRGQLCRHPLEYRVGTRCAACGATAHRA